MRFTRIVLAVGFVAGLGVALAQQPGRGGFGGGMGGPGMLLMNKGVQEELKLTDEQKERIQGVGKATFEKYQDDFADLRNLPQDEQREKRTALMKKIGDENDKAYGEILSKDQSKRLKQINWQNMKARAFLDEDVQKAIKMTDEQKDKVKTINADAEKAFAEANPRRGGGGGGGFDAEAFKKMQEKRTEMQKETLEKVNAVLTSDQKVAFKDLTGAPYEVKFEGFGPGGRGGRGKDKGKDK
jgi:hypothetical protein